jgi:hypothetical protein
MNNFAMSPIQNLAKVSDDVMLCYHLTESTAFSATSSLVELVWTLRKIEVITACMN